MELNDHASRLHAVLSASSSARWLACPPSAQLCAVLPDKVTDYAREGTCAHELAEYKVQKLLGNPASNPTENLDFYDAEMEDSTDSYAQYIAEQLANLQEPIVLVEQRLDFSRYVPSGFGTGDCVIVADDVLTVIDFKYGKGVAVSADHNSQMMLYALGALQLFDALYDIAEIRMVIFQPRIQSVSECVMPISELLHWAETELKTKAELASKGEGDFCAGKHCRFCKVKATCRKRAEYNLQLAQYDFAPPEMLVDTEIEAVLEKLINWFHGHPISRNMLCSEQFPANSGMGTKLWKVGRIESIPMRQRSLKKSRLMGKIRTTNRNCWELPQ